MVNAGWYNSGWLSGGADEVPDHRIDVVLEAGAGEHAVVADTVLDMARAPVAGDVGADAVRRLGLARRAKAVLAALYRQQRRLPQGAEIHRRAFVGQLAGRDMMFEEKFSQRFNVETFGHVEHRKIFIVKT